MGVLVHDSVYSVADLRARRDGAWTRVLNRFFDTLVLIYLCLAVPTATAGADELYNLQKVIGQPLTAAIEQFTGGTTAYSSRPSRPLYELRGWRGLSRLLFDTTPTKAAAAAPLEFLVTSVRLEFSDAQRVSPAQAQEFLKRNLGIDVATGEKRYDPKQNLLEYFGVGANQWKVGFEAYQIPIHFKNGGIELRPDHAEPISERVAQILMR